MGNDKEQRVKEISPALPNSERMEPRDQLGLLTACESMSMFVKGMPVGVSKLWIIISASSLAFCRNRLFPECS